MAFVDNGKTDYNFNANKIYPLATFLVVIGGLLVFGLKGAIIAPMVLAAFYRLYIFTNWKRRRIRSEGGHLEYFCRQ